MKLRELVVPVGYCPRVLRSAMLIAHTWKVSPANNCLPSGVIASAFAVSEGKTE